MPPVGYQSRDREGAEAESHVWGAFAHGHLEMSGHAALNGEQRGLDRDG
ncbi:MAG: hypothetical protein IID37_15285 [Planctomycetes bacterium]|nr:hypothetical protein [Planctomycetota bacterium]